MRQTVKISEDFDLEVKLGAGNELDTGVERIAASASYRDLPSKNILRSTFFTV